MRELDYNKTVLDYIQDQCDRYDVINLKKEHNMIHTIDHIYDNMRREVMKVISIYNDISTTLKYQNIINRIQSVVTMAYNDMYREFTPFIEEYTKSGYEHFGDLIDIGMEITDMINKEKVAEMQITSDPDAISFMRNHAFEQVTNIGDTIINQARSQLGMLLASRSYDKKAVVDMIQSIMDVNRSRANMIAQTEMSMAYNAGAMARLEEFNRISTNRIQKYWYGFKFSEVTCTYCRPRIGNVYDVDDNSERLPAHPRCRCVWLPYMDGWDKPISSLITRKADMLRRVYSPDEIYNRINKRLGIDYASYINLTDARKFIGGDRSADIMKAIANARDRRIDDVVDAFGISSVVQEEYMKAEFKIQMKFWKDYTGTLIVDGDTETLGKAYEAIKGIMVIPWNATQLDRWNQLLKQIKKYMD